MSKQQIHKAKIKIPCSLEIPQHLKDTAVEFDLMAGDETIGRLEVSGAHVYFENPAGVRKHWSFSKFVELLEKN